MYTKLLADAVRELKGERAEPSVDPVVTVEVEAYLPESYVPEVNQRLVFYKRLAGLADPAGIDEVRAELIDRFGPLPPPTVHLLEVVALRVKARELGIEKVEALGGVALLSFAPSTSVAPDRVVRAIAESRGRLRLRKEFVLEAQIPRGPWPTVRRGLEDLLECFQ